MALPFAAIFNVFQTVITFIQGIVTTVAPAVSKYVESKTAATTESSTTINPDCRPPRCYSSSSYCPDEDLSSQCRERQKSFDYRNNYPPFVTSAISTTKKAVDASTSPNETIILIFLVIIVVAVVAFLVVRNKSKDNDDSRFDDRRSSVMSV